MIEEYSKKPELAAQMMRNLQRSNRDLAYRLRDAYKLIEHLRELLQKSQQAPSEQRSEDDSTCG
jgi:hypothetical protein